MKLTKPRRSAAIAGKAVLKKSGGIQKRLRRKKKLIIKSPKRTTKRTSILNIIPDVDTVRKKKKKTERTYTPDISSSSENISTPGSAESLYYCSPGSRAPLVIDSPTTYRGQPAFSFADVSFESSDAEVSVVSPKILRKTVLKKASKETKHLKRKRSLSNASVSSGEIIATQDKDIGLFPVREWCLLIAVLPHPVTVKLSGTVLVQVISGSIKILGHVVEQFHGIVPVFSSSKVMYLDIKTEHTESICRQASRLQVVKDLLLQNKVPESMADRILNLCDNSSVIVGFRKNFKSSDVHFASSLLPSAFSIKAKKNSLKSSDFRDFGFRLDTDDSTNMDFPECENFISDVFSSIKDSDEKSIAAPRIIAQGNKGLGKSTFLRYCINRILNEFDTVYYLDADPGQSEFTPAGCVSLVKVTAPLLGPPFTHQTTPEKMYFLGATDVQDIADKYCTCVQLLCEYYKENFSVIPLFVNTMGWVVGMGLKLLTQLKSFIDPTHIVKIVDDRVRGNGRFQADFEPPNFTAKEYIYDRFSPSDDNKVLMNAADRRNLSILSYLGKCMKPYSSVCPLNSITPYCIHWKDVALYAGDLKHATEHMFYIFNGTWVALLSVNKSMIAECENPAFPKLLVEDPVGEDCYGFGVIRGIDVSKKVFYIITPEPADRLKRVNAIVKGDIHLPSVLYTHQEARKPLPYVTQLTGESSIASKSVPRRKYRPKKFETPHQ